MRSVHAIYFLGLLSILSNADTVKITSKPTSSARQDTLYSYSIVATSSTGSPIALRVQGPDGTEINGNLITWTPTAAQSRGPNAFTVTASSQAGGTASQYFRITPAGTVTGSKIVNYLGTPVPTDFSKVTIAAYVPNRLGGYKTLPGQGTSAGSFSIDGVPRGFYLLQFGNRYLWTSNSVVDLGFSTEYRAGVQQSYSGATSLTFDVSNLNSGQSTDTIELVGPNNLAYNTYFVNPGDAAFAGNFPYYGGLSDATQGDQQYLLQLSTQNLAGVPFVGLDRYFAPPLFTQTDGSDTPISGTFTSVPQTHKFEANINGADLVQELQGSNPGAQLLSTIVFLDAYPGTLAKGVATLTPDLAGYIATTVGPSTPLITTNADFGAVMYGNPFPSTWHLFAGYSWFGYVSVLAPGATLPTSLQASIFGETSKLPTSTSPIPALVGVPNSPLINGMDFFANQSGVGVTPTLTWSAPARGRASYYRILVYSLTNSYGGTIARNIAQLQTRGRSLTIPPGLLTAGQGYVFQITSAFVTNVDVTKTPFQIGPTFGLADVISGTIQP